MSDCWKYKNKDICSVDDIPEEFRLASKLHMIYKITSTNPDFKEYKNHYYIGKKIFLNTTRVRLTKKRKLELNTRKVFEFKVKESNWKDYYGSSTHEVFKRLLTNKKYLKREILMFVDGKTEASFYEAKYLFSDEGMMNDKCMNLNILNKFFKSKLK